jgi:hypothetical protein
MSREKGEKFLFHVDFFRVLKWLSNVMQLEYSEKNPHGVRKKVAEALGVAETMAGRYYKVGFHSDILIYLATKYHLSLDELLWKELGFVEPPKLPTEGEEKPSYPGYREVLRHTASREGKKEREEDKFYAETPALRSEGPEFVGGKQILKLYLHKDFYNMCNLQNLRFVVLMENNFSPAIVAGSILVVDTSNHKITSSYYLMAYGDGEYALRRLDPMGTEMVRVTSRDAGPAGAEARDFPTEEVRSQIIGRVVWVVMKV